MSEEAQVHRFRDHVATYVARGQTVYLTPSEAIMLGNALIAAAIDVMEQPDFCKSTLPTFNMTFDGEKK